MVGGLKECGNFAGEKKGTFLLATILHYNYMYGFKHAYIY